jgi:putative ABC transport system permease protein
MIIKNHALFALRQILKERLLNVVMLVSLGGGIATLVLIAFYAYKEWNYDRYHNHADNIYRVITEYRLGSETNPIAWTSGAVATAIKEQIPEVTQAVRLFRYRSPSVLREQQSAKTFSEDNFIWADTNVFDIFSFQFVKGTREQGLKRPNTMVITESASRRYFGEVDPVGKVLTNVTFNADFEITGVIRDMPERSHFKADFICSLSTLPALWGNILDSWGNSFLYTYIDVRLGADVTLIENKLNEIAQSKIPVTAEASILFSLQPLTYIHLNSHIQNEWQTNGDIKYVYMLLLTGVLILFIAIVNFVNLGIARSENRTKEISIRQTLGISKGQLLIQFIIENVTTGILALLISFLLVETIQPLFVHLFSENLELTFNEKVKLWMLISPAVLILMIVTTIYPARIVSKLPLSYAIKGPVVKLSRGMGLWQSLIAFQIFVTVLLISSSTLIYRQLSFISTAPKGYHPESLLNVYLLSDDAQKNYERFKTKLLQNPRIKSASACSHIIGETLYQSEYVLFDQARERTKVMWQRIHVDPDFCQTYGIKLVAGKNFSNTNLGDTASFIINEAACRYLNLKQPNEAVGLQVEYEDRYHGRVIGVMKDFHFKTLHQVIEPMIIHIVPERFRMLTVNMDTAQFANTLSWIRTEWNTFDPTSPFVYTSPEDSDLKNYGFERKFARLIAFFTVVAFMLSACGLIGLMMYILNLKRKEISIRKILGAETLELIIKFSKRFVWINLVGLACAVPLAWYAGNLWLNNFAYRVEVTAIVFIVAGSITLLLSAISIAFPLLQAVRENPATVLRES